MRSNSASTSIAARISLMSTAWTTPGVAWRMACCAAGTPSSSRRVRTSSPCLASGRVSQRAAPSTTLPGVEPPTAPATSVAVRAAMAAAPIAALTPQCSSSVAPP